MPQDDNFLRDFFIDCQNRMRRRIETELELQRMLFTIYPIIVTAIIGLNKLITDKLIFLGITIWIAIFLILLTKFVDSKIRAEHEGYEITGQQVVKIWKYFKLFETGAYIGNDTILDYCTAKDYGKGKGYLKTLKIIWGVTVMIIILLIFIGYVAFTRTHQPS